MISEIEIQGFKSFEKVRLKLGGLNLFIGANASGKSNFFDALRVLQGIGYGFRVEEILNGKPKGAGAEVWEGIRGGRERAAFKPRKGSSVEQMSFAVAGDAKNGTPFRYAIAIATKAGRFHSESLTIGEVPIPAFPRASQESSVTHLAGSVRIEKTHPYISDEPSLQSELASGKLKESQEGVVRHLIRTLRDLQRVEPSPTLLRTYSESRAVQRMGERGENFAALVRSILADEGLRSAYLSWLRQLTPLELDDVAVLEGALGEPLFALKEGTDVLPAPILSDGTLRFAAITAALFQPDMPSVIAIEEIENGIHPSRLRLLVELLKSQSRGSGPQVMATTHSPVVLAWLEESDYETTFLCKRDEETGVSVITPLSEIPHLIDLVRKQPIGELFTEGWLEGAF